MLREFITANLFCLLLPLAPFALADGLDAALEKAGVNNPMRAQVDYMLHCMGCHGAEGAGTPDASVPAMKNFVGRFLTVTGGREFLIRVPGVANAALSDVRLAELLNWMLVTISAPQMPANFQPYTANEVAKLRAHPLVDVVVARSELLSRLEDQRH